MKSKQLFLNAILISLVTTSAFSMQPPSPYNDRQPIYQPIVAYPNSINPDEIKPVYGTFNFKNDQDNKSLIAKINGLQYQTQKKELDIQPIIAHLPNNRQLGIAIAQDWKQKRELTQPIAQIHNNRFQNNWKTTILGTAIVSSGLTSFLLWKTGNLTNISWEGAKSFVFGLLKTTAENPPAAE